MDLDTLFGHSTKAQEPESKLNVEDMLKTIRELRAMPRPPVLFESKAIDGQVYQHADGDLLAHPAAVAGLFFDAQKDAHTIQDTLRNPTMPSIGGIQIISLEGALFGPDSDLKMRAEAVFSSWLSLKSSHNDSREDAS